MTRIVLTVVAVLFAASCSYDASINRNSITSSGPGLEISRMLVGTANVYPQTRISVLNNTKRKILVDGRGLPPLGRILRPGDRTLVVFHGTVRGGEDVCLFAYGLDSSGVRTGEVNDRCFRLAWSGVREDSWIIRGFYRPGD